MNKKRSKIICQKRPVCSIAPEKNVTDQFENLLKHFLQYLRVRIHVQYTSYRIRRHLLISLKSRNRNYTQME